MEMVASSKMRKAQERGLAGRPYTQKIEQVIADLAALPQSEGAFHPLLQRRPVKKIAIVHSTPDRGLSGGLDANNQNCFFYAPAAGTCSLITIGREIDYMRNIAKQ
jgi:F-type H+-transporting ATPase subunit gamma